MKSLFWITAEKTSLHEERAHALASHMISVSWFSDLSSLIEKMAVHRAYIILVDEGLTSQKTCALISQLLHISDLRGARFILSVRHYLPEVMNLAASSNFRDMIPLDLDEKQWIFRLLFSSAGTSIDYYQPEGQILFRKSAKIEFPCRLVSLNGSELRIECQLSPEPLTTIHLGGHLADALNLPHLDYVVDKIEQTHLTYRFSHAFIGTLHIPEDKRGIFESQARLWQKMSPAPKTRVFIAAKTAALRQSLQNFFALGDYMLNSALQLKSLTTEPKYFSPEIVVIEKLLCIGEHQERFYQMLQNVPDTSHVIIVGIDAERTKVIAEHLAIKQKLYPLPKLTHEDLKALIATLASSKQKSAADILFDPHSPLSLARIMLSGKLTHLHPLCCEIALPIPSKPYALCQVSTPLTDKWLKRPLWMKITQLKKMDDDLDLAHVCSAEGLFVDIRKNETESLARNLSSYLRTILSKYLEKKPAVAATPADPLSELKVDAQSLPVATMPPPPEPIMFKQDIEPIDKEPKIPEEILLYRQRLALRKRKEKDKASAKLWIVRYIGFLIFASATLIYLITKFVPMLEHIRGHSGRHYVEQLFIFSKKPHNHEEHEEHKEQELP